MAGRSSNSRRWHTAAGEAVAAAKSDEERAADIAQIKSIRESAKAKVAAENIRKRRERQEKERAEYHNGRTDFPESEIHGRTSDNNVALYAVSWTFKGKPTGNSWMDKRIAHRVMKEKQAEGTLLGTLTTYCAGFAF